MLKWVVKVLFELLGPGHLLVFYKNHCSIGYSMQFGFYTTQLSNVYAASQLSKATRLLFTAMKTPIPGIVLSRLSIQIIS